LGVVAEEEEKLIQEAEELVEVKDNVELDK